MINVKGRRACVALCFAFRRLKWKLEKSMFFMCFAWILNRIVIKSVRYSSAHNYFSWSSKRMKGMKLNLVLFIFFLFDLGKLIQIFWFICETKMRYFSTEKKEMRNYWLERDQYKMQSNWKLAEKRQNF